MYNTGREKTLEGLKGLDIHHNHREIGIFEGSNGLDIHLNYR